MEKEEERLLMEEVMKRRKKRRDELVTGVKGSSTKRKRKGRVWG